MDLTNEDVADILALLESLPYDELDLRTSRFRLTLRRTPGGWTQARQDTGEAAVTNAPLADGSGPPGQPAVTTPDPGTSPRDNGNLIDITSPLPGTFYRAPRPGAAPFVEAGSAVEPDTVVAIVETMKLMNSVHAGSRGTVQEIIAGNAEAVAQGATLMRLKPEP
jgi:acetyl-CoA carboxylase biotin carboxyl carrier protein